MALGAKLKIEMDTSAVRRGLASIRSAFSRLGATLRGIGGAMRKSLVPVVGVLAGFGVAAKNVADLGSELSDMSVQTGVSVEKLVEMREALRLAGAPVRDASRMLSMMASNIQEARFEAGAARDALEILGIPIRDIANARMDEQFEMILRRIRDAGGEIPQLERAMEGIFGARMGFGILRLAKDLDANMAQAAKNSRSFGKFMGANATELDKTADALGRIGMIFQELFGRILVFLPLDKIADAINAIDVSKISEGLGAMLSDIPGFFRGLWEQVKDMGKRIGEGIVEVVHSAGKAIGQEVGEGIKSAFGRLGDVLTQEKEPSLLHKAIFGLPPLRVRSEAGVDSRRLIETAEEQTKILRKIERKEGASFA